MAAAQDGDSGAYQALLRACLPLIAATARRQGVAEPQVDDVVQETLITLHRVRHTYDPSRPFRPWLRAIAQRRALDLLRHQGRRGRRETTAEAEAADMVPDPAPGPAQMLEGRQFAEQLNRAVAALPPGQREAVTRLALAGETLQEAAAASGRSTGALKVNLHRALAALRRTLGGEESHE